MQANSNYCFIPVSSGKKYIDNYVVLWNFAAKLEKEGEIMKGPQGPHISF